MSAIRPIRLFALAALLAAPAAYAGDAANGKELFMANRAAAVSRDATAALCN